MSPETSRTQAMATLSSLRDGLRQWAQISKAQEQAVAEGRIEEMSSLVAQRGALMTTLEALFSEVAEIKRTAEADASNPEWSMAVAMQMTEVFALGTESARADERTARLVAQRLHSLSSEMQTLQHGRLRRLAYDVSPPSSARFLDRNL
ncbi:MAG: hypothetical protein IT209_11175 [Armatimonadetes bacterium]|nr:hypothetical protein [Armatimonadota bacterium]